MTRPEPASTEPEESSARRMIPALKWILVAYALFMLVLIALVCTGDLRPIQALTPIGPIVYLFARRFIEGTWDWMFLPTETSDR